VTRVVVLVNGKRRLDRRGRDIRAVSIKRPRGKRFTVKLVNTLSTAPPSPALAATRAARRRRRRRARAKARLAGFEVVDQRVLSRHARAATLRA